MDVIATWLFMNYLIPPQRDKAWNAGQECGVPCLILGAGDGITATLLDALSSLSAQCWKNKTTVMASGTGVVLTVINANSTIQLSSVKSRHHETNTRAV